MKFTARYKFIASFAGEACLNSSELIEVELSEAEVNNLKKLMKSNKIDETSLGEFGWFLVKAKKLAKQEKNELKRINTFREKLYKPSILHTERPNPKEKSIIWKNHLENEKELSEQYKIERDRKLYKEIQAWRRSIKKPLTKIKFNIGGVEVKVESDYLLTRIQDILPKTVPIQLQYIIDRIGIDDQYLTKSKTKPYIELKNFTSNLYRFLNLYTVETKINLIGGGILFMAGFVFPFQDTYKNIETFNFDNVNDKNNKRYSDYFRDISKTDILVKATKYKKTRLNPL